MPAEGLGDARHLDGLAALLDRLALRRLDVLAGGLEAEARRILRAPEDGAENRTRAIGDDDLGALLHRAEALRQLAGDLATAGGGGGLGHLVLPFGFVCEHKRS